MALKNEELVKEFLTLVIKGDELKAKKVFNGISDEDKKELFAFCLIKRKS